MNQLFKWKPQWLTMGLSAWIIRMGQQSLPIFLCCMSLSYIGGIALDWSRRDPINVAMVNLAGIGLLLLMAQALAWLDGKPWKLAVAHDLTTRSSSTLLNKPNSMACTWGEQALFLLFLISLTVFPLLLLQTANNIDHTSSEIMAQLPSSDAFQKVNAVMPKANPEPALENQQQL
jgi:hypothetical protein